MNYFEKMCQMTHYQPKSSMWNEITSHEALGSRKLKRNLNFWVEKCKDDKFLGTELTLVLNWKVWQHSENNNILMAKLYQEYWKQIDSYICDHWKGEDLSYFLKETD